MALLLLKVIAWSTALIMLLIFVSQVVDTILSIYIPTPKTKATIHLIPPALAAILFYILSRLP
jgi:hypothetical protein